MAQVDSDSDSDSEEEIGRGIARAGYDNLDEDTLRRLERNDPDIAGLRLTPENWIKGAGQVLGENKSLLKLDIEADDSEDVIWLEEVFTGLSRNRNLESLTLSRMILRDPHRDVDYESELMCNFRHLAPFFEYNCNLLSLELSELYIGKVSHYLASALAKCEYSRLESITLCELKVNDKQLATIIRSLSGKKFLQDVSITINGTDGDHTCRELSKLLESPSTKIKSLHLDWDEDMLRKPEDRILTIAKGLMVNWTVKTISLPLYHIRSSSFTVWNVVLQVFSRPMSSIETLNLESSVLGNDDLTHLSDALADNKTLKELILSDNEGVITLAGWRHLFRCLENDDFALQVLNISGCYITNDSITSIALSLSSNTCLKKLDISHNNISLQGWMSFFSCLLFVNPEIRRSRCSLEFIDMRGAEDQDGVIGDVERGEEVLKAILYNSLCSCNMSSVEDILSANHTLHTILRGGFGWSKEISELLELNAIEDKGEVARLKAIKYHFSSCKESGMRGKDRIFADLPDAVLPNALEWIGRGPNRDGFSLMYNVCHCFPTLVEVREANDIPSHKRMKKEGWNKSGIGD
jgi:hypothetical protein